MSEVTINIPAEHVEEIRDLLRHELCMAANSVGNTWGEADTAELRQELSEIHAYERMLDQLGWDAPESPSDGSVTGDERWVREFMKTAFAFASEGIDESDRQAARALIARAAWISDTLDSLEPEGVPA